MGVVTRGPAGTPVGGAVVRAETAPFAARAADCATATYYADVRGTRAVADSLGHYRLTFSASSPADSACVRAVASRGGSGTDSVITAPFRMRLVADYGTRERPVERRVDLRLP
jgi:hypothetical protein